MCKNEKLPLETVFCAYSSLHPLELPLDSQPLTFRGYLQAYKDLLDIFFRFPFRGCCWLSLPRLSPPYLLLLLSSLSFVVSLQHLSSSLWFQIHSCLNYNLFRAFGKALYDSSILTVSYKLSAKNSLWILVCFLWF